MKRNHTNENPTWQDALHEKSIWIMLFLGFSAGLPILLVFGTLGNWLNEAGVSKSTITYFSWAGLGYSFKFVWAPLIDQARLPILTQLFGKRRAWLLLCQIFLLLILGAMAMVDPTLPQGLTMMAVLAVALGFTSASQDIVIDAYRIEITPPRFLGLSSSSYILGYRIGMIIAGTLALILSEKLGSTLGNYHYQAWQTTYFVMAAFMLIGILTTLVIREPIKEREALDSSASKQLVLLFITLLVPFILVYIVWQPILTMWFDFSESSAKALGPLGSLIYESLRLLFALLVCFLTARLVIILNLVKPRIATTAYWTPIQEFIQRYPLKLVILILLLIGFYRVSDMVLGGIANVFYQDIGFNKEQIGYISKFFGLGMTIFGSFFGGFLIARYGTMKMMIIGAVLAALTNLLFVWLANVGAVESLLYLVISADNLAAGIANIAFVTFLSRLSNIQFTAMQYALFTSLMALLPGIIRGYSGTIVDATDYQTFFFITMLMGLPVILLVWLVGKRLTLSEDKA